MKERLEIIEKKIQTEKLKEASLKKEIEIIEADIKKETEAITELGYNEQSLETDIIKLENEIKDELTAVEIELGLKENAQVKEMQKNEDEDEL